jgi:hypothetical protein
MDDKYAHHAVSYVDDDNYGILSRGKAMPRRPKIGAGALQG